MSTKTCTHDGFNVAAKVSRFEDTGTYMADIGLTCANCGIKMQFLGLEPGVDTFGARVSVDGLEARLTIAPEGAKPNPLQRIQFGIKGFNA